MTRITSGCRVAQLPLVAHQAWHGVTHHPGGILVALMYLGRTSVGESPEQQGLAGCFPRVGKVQNSISYIDSLSCRGY